MDDSIQLITNYKQRHHVDAQQASPSARTHLDLGGATRCGYRYTPDHRGKESIWAQHRGDIGEITCQRCLELMAQDEVGDEMGLPGWTGGRLIATHRVRLGKTQTELAEDLNTCQWVIRLYEQGRQLPLRKTLVRLSRALGLSREQQESLFRAYGKEMPADDTHSTYVRCDTRISSIA